MDQIPYAPKPFAALIAGLFMLGCGCFLIHMGITNDRGLILNGFIKFSENGATIFYWVLGLFSIGLGGMGLIQCALALFGEKRFLELGPHSMKVPGMLLIGETEVQYLEILKMKEVKVQKSHTLVLEPMRGKKVRINAKFMSPDDYARVVQTLALKATNARK